MQFQHLLHNVSEQTTSEAQTIQLLDAVYPQLSQTARTRAERDFPYIAQALVDCQKATPILRRTHQGTEDVEDELPVKIFAEDQPFGVLKLIGPTTYTLDRCVFDEVRIGNRKTLRLEQALAFGLQLLENDADSDGTKWWKLAMEHVRRGEPAELRCASNLPRFAVLIGAKSLTSRPNQ